MSNEKWTFRARPINLFDVQIYMAKRLVAISQSLQDMRFASWDSSNYGEPQKQIIQKALAIVLEESEFLGIQGTSETARVFLDDLEGLNVNEVFDRVDNLEKVFLLGMQKIDLIFIPHNRLRFLSESETLFGEQFRVAFPSANHEISEASKAFAAERFTACVFHLMRALERGLRVLASGLGLPDPIKGNDRNWRNMLSAIKAQIDSNNGALRNDANWQRDKDFYEKSYAFLEGVRNPVRNATMHVEADYDEQGAADVLNACSSFLRHLATKLAE
ncbi:MAG: hypothetical protein ABSG78_16410 [Verrucomicrobiota bacterium]|jgi:hypothetical protein